MITALYILVPGSRILTDGFAVFIQGSELFIVNATRAQIAQISEADFIGAGFTGGLISIVSDYMKLMMERVDVILGHISVCRDEDRLLHLEHRTKRIFLRE